MRLHTKAKLHLLKRFFVARDNSRRDRRRWKMEAVRHAVKPSKALLDQPHKLTVVQIAGRRDDHVIGSKALTVKIKYLLLLKRPYRVLGPQNRLAQRMVFPKALRKDLMDKIVRVIFVHFNFFQDHALFAVNVIGSKNRVQNQIAQDIDGGGN